MADLVGRTKYPERYRRSDTAPDFFLYEDRPPTPVGGDLYDVLGTDGVIVAARKSRRQNERYWLDPDLVLHGEADTTHYIWMRDSWQEFAVRYKSSPRLRSEVSLAASREEVLDA